jgi:hypothetical protein
MHRSSELRRVLFGQYIAESQRFRPEFVITQHPHQYFLVNLVASIRQALLGAEGVV